MARRALPRQLERLANLPTAANVYEHLGSFPTTVRSSNSTECDTNLSQSRENNKKKGGGENVSLKTIAPVTRTIICYWHAKLVEEKIDLNPEVSHKIFSWFWV